MALGKKKSDLVLSVAQLQDADYSKQPELGAIYHRIASGRVQFEEAFSNDIKAVMEISSLELSLKHHADSMSALSNNVLMILLYLSLLSSISASASG